MKQLTMLLLTLCFATNAQADFCDDFPNSATCPGAPPSPGEILGPPPWGCPGYDTSLPGVPSNGIVVMPNGLPLNCCDELIIFPDGAVLPPHPSADQATAQAWASDAYGSDSNTNRHYYLSWWTLYQVSGVSCSGGLG